MDIRTYLAKGKPLVFDGGMGTYFAAMPGRAEIQCERGNLEYPDEISAIHREYLEAGCRAIKTNTFAAAAAAAEGNEDYARMVIQAGCRLAIEAAGPYGAYVFADIGPALYGKGADPETVYIRQADLFLKQGVTHFLLETLPSDEGIPGLARHLKASCPSAFLIVSYAVQPDGVTREGRLGYELFRRTAAIPQVDAVGFNCVSGPLHMLEYIRGLEIGDATLSVMPNAGYPTVLCRHTVYQGKPNYFAEKMAEIVETGAGIVGGCCGTTPEHIACLVKALEGASTGTPSLAVRTEARPKPRPSVNRFWDKLESGKRVFAVELDPPVDADAAQFLEDAQFLHDHGADAVTIADCPVGRPRADSSLLACKLKRELGVEPLPHMTCRDRNLNATKALLLGLAMEDVRNVLLVTGDPIPTAERDEVKSVFNFNSRKLARFVTSLGDTALPAPFRVYGALNLNARNFDVQLQLAREKEENGVSAFLTQPVLSQGALDNLKQARQVLRGRILGGIFPVVSSRNANFLNNEVSGIYVCDEIVKLYEGKEREEAEELAVDISARVAAAIAPYTDGYYIMTPFRRVGLVARIIEKIQAG